MENPEPVVVATLEEDKVALEVIEETTSANEEAVSSTASVDNTVAASDDLSELQAQLDLCLAKYENDHSALANLPNSEITALLDKLLKLQALLAPTPVAAASSAVTTENISFGDFSHDELEDFTSVVEAPVEAQVEAPTAEAQVEAPAAEAQVEAPAAEAKVEAPAAEAKVEAPAAEAQVEAPAAEAQVEAPAAEAQVEAQDAEAKVEAPDAEVQVAASAVEAQVEVPVVQTVTTEMLVYNSPEALEAFMQQQSVAATDESDFSESDENETASELAGMEVRPLTHAFDAYVESSSAAAFDAVAEELKQESEELKQEAEAEQEVAEHIEAPESSVSPRPAV